MTAPIAVHVRVRPHKARDGDFIPAHLVVREKGISVRNQHGDLQYEHQYDKSHDQDSTQEDIFAAVVPLVDHVLKGQNASLFAYGVSGSGKTHTMQGTPDAPGIIPRVVKNIFAWRNLADGEAEINVRFSYLEIWKDEAYDLLKAPTHIPFSRQPAQREKLRLCDDESGVLRICGLNVVPIDSCEEFDKLYQTAARTRKTAATKLNDISSRSHAILTLEVEITDMITRTVKHGKITLTDLAGSENNNGTGNTGEQARESATINKSLTALGSVVQAIITKSGTSRIPYRDCKLTRLLQDVLSGSATGLMICCLAPGEKFAKDNINTLNFATRITKLPELKPTGASGTNSSGAATFVSRRSSVTPALASVPVPVTTAARSIRPMPLQARGVNILPGPRRLSVFVDKQEKKPSARRTSQPAPVSRLVPIHDVGTDEGAAKIAGQLRSIQVSSTDLDRRTPAPPAEVIVDTIHNTDHRSQSLLEAGTSEHTATQWPVTVDENRARILLLKAREFHSAGNLALALRLYQKSQIYLPQPNPNVTKRITDLELQVDGSVPPEVYAPSVPPDSWGKRSRMAEPDSLGARADRADLPTPNKRRRG